MERRHRRGASRPMGRVVNRRSVRLNRKRLFEVSFWDERDPRGGTNTLIALADDAVDLCNLEVFDSAEIVTLVPLPGLVAASGPSRVIGAIRRTWGTSPGR